MYAKSTRSIMIMLIGMPLFAAGFPIAGPYLIDKSFQLATYSAMFSRDGQHFVFVSRESGTQFMTSPSGEIISDGFQQFTKLDKHIWIARQNDMNYVLRDGKTISSGYSMITRTSTGFDATTTNIYWKLDQNGKVLSWRHKDGSSSASG